MVILKRDEEEPPPKAYGERECAPKIKKEEEPDSFEDFGKTEESLEERVEEEGKKGEREEILPEDCSGDYIMPIEYQSLETGEEYLTSRLGEEEEGWIGYEGVLYELWFGEGGEKYFCLTMEREDGDDSGEVGRRYLEKINGLLAPANQEVKRHLFA